MSLPASVNNKEMLPRYLVLRSGLALHLVDYTDPDTGELFLRMADTDLEATGFDPLMKYITDYLNSARRRIVLRNETRLNPRYTLSDVRRHVVVLASDTANAREMIKPGYPTVLRCKVAAKNGLIEIEGAWKQSQALGVITACLSRPSLLHTT